MRGDFSLQSGHDAAARILAMADRPSAVFCAADMVAFGLISGLQEGGVSVPGDISVIGFDGIDMAEYYVPALTTIWQDRHRIGLRAAALLLDRLACPDDPVVPQVNMVDVALMMRDSRAPPA
ncbi:substrate-binding domain-containing protein [Rhodophyticola sp. CCM32]|uniref:substrate-binding domain-containing protein n=1 Tax=Rhodophyticola sp. CCM32 TaxID=2916397 RepID=UPI001EE5E62C|nr:substrate-binding domain-containing protein [Rhodophyticola sp. CCM32]